eukprot:TRINITY_DN10450_c0_g2_i1.p1 TRINITY_DN10450_c0_g2~~TRINITY_DN10450_c0_g2_i1.p1  ORF type:complete len:234 (-),score=31.99 TRINITY_DN10450_c0_g2_i1:245-946(-)
MGFLGSLSMKIVVLASLINVAGSTTLFLASGPAVPLSAAGASTAGAAAGSTAAGAAGAAGTAGAAGAAGTASTVAAGTAATGTTAAGTAALLQQIPAATSSSLLLALGAIVVGAQADPVAVAVSWDCWKPILHETSLAPSRGRPLMDILNDPAVVDSQVGTHSVFVRNRWNESWRIDPLILPWGQLVAHASQVVSVPFNVSAGHGGTSGKTYATNMTEALTPQIVFADIMHKH